jgi:hypothetical protein
MEERKKNMLLAVFVAVVVVLSIVVYIHIKQGTNLFIQKPAFNSHIVNFYTWLVKL